MKQILLAALSCILFFSTVFGQGNPSEAQKLNQQMTTLFQQGNLDESASIAEQIVKLQQAEKPSNPNNLITALENLGQIKLTRFKKALTDLAAPDLKPDNVKNIVEKMQKDGVETETIFREILNLAKGHPKVPAEQIIGVKTNLAWLLYNFFPKNVNLPIGFDKQTKDKFDGLHKAGFFKRINEAEAHFSEALKNSETTLGEDSDMTILSRYKLAEFQLSIGKLEEAIIQYQKCIDTIEKKFGKNSQDLLLPLDSYLKVLVATGQEDPAFEVLSRIVQITKKNAQFPKILLNLSLRADKSFVSSNSPAVERREQENKDAAYLSRQGSVIRSGATGNAASEQTFNASTFSGLYYENTKEIRVVKIPVKVLVDEAGKVIEAEGLIDDKEYKKAAEEIVKGWKFRPFEKPVKLRGYVECIFLAGQFRN
jgi:tetratricopeptide (TPR) repeat protein